MAWHAFRCLIPVDVAVNLPYGVDPQSIDASWLAEAEAQDTAAIVPLARDWSQFEDVISLGPCSEAREAAA